MFKIPFKPLETFLKPKTLIILTKMPTTVRTTDRVPIILTKMPTTMQENTNEYTFLEPYQLFAYMCICMVFGTLSVVRIYVYAWFLEPYQLFAYMCICMVFGTLSVVRIYVYAYIYIYAYIHVYAKPCKPLETSVVENQSYIRLCIHVYTHMHSRIYDVIYTHSISFIYD